MNTSLPALLICCILSLGTVACTPKTSPSLPISLSDAEHIFDSLQVTGTLVLVAQGQKDTLIYNRERADTRYSPASTYKIPNSLIALEEKAIPDEKAVLPWDGQKRWVDGWNHDHDLRSAFHESVVWYYQELARRIGPEKYVQWHRTLSYGNQLTGPAVDSFWLNGDVRISAREQVHFLDKLHKREFPFSPRTYDIFIDSVFVYEKTDTYTWCAKTGWASAPDPDVGWFVGWLEKEGQVFYYALNIDMLSDEDVAKRKWIIEYLFKKAGWI